MMFDGLKLRKKLTFGTAGLIRNHRELSVVAEPWQAWVGRMGLPGEWQRYKEFTFGNHVWEKDALFFTGRLDRSKFKGGFDPVQAILVKDAGVSGATTLLYVDPKIAEAVSGAAVGMVSATNPLHRLEDHRVVGAAPNVGMVVVFPALPAGLKAGAQVLFLPPITSAAAWFKPEFDLALGQGKTFAVDLELVFPDDTAKGAWPAGWGYQRVTTANRGEPFGNVEIDFAECYADKDRTMALWSGNNHTQTKLVYGRADGGWTPMLGGGYSKAPKGMAGAHRISCRIEPTRTLKFVDGELIREDEFVWGQKRPLQLGVNLAIGDQRQLWRGLRPTADADFTNMRFGLKSLAIYEE